MSAAHFSFMGICRNTTFEVLYCNLFSCYSIGTILDGIIQPERADSSRGARYNSAIRYIEKQKQEGKKTFIVVVSEDGYINCFSTEE